MGLISSLPNGISKAKNLLLSEDVLAALNVIKKLGIHTNLKIKIWIYEKLNGYKYKKLSLDAKNSGTLGRLLLGLMVNTPYQSK